MEFDSPPLHCFPMVSFSNFRRHLLRVGFILSTLLLGGCISTSKHIYTYIVKVPFTPDSSSNVVSYQYRGLKDSDTLILRNERNFESAISFDSIQFPPRSQWAKLNLSAEDGNRLQAQSRKVLSEYFGTQHRIKVVTYKEVFKTKEQSFLIDAISPHRHLSAAETLLECGLSTITDVKLVRRSGKKHLLGLQDSARRANLGLWKNHHSNNIHYHHD